MSARICTKLKASPKLETLVKLFIWPRRLCRRAPPFVPGKIFPRSSRKVPANYPLRAKSRPPDKLRSAGVCKTLRIFHNNDLFFREWATLRIHCFRRKPPPTPTPPPPHPPAPFPIYAVLRVILRIKWFFTIYICYE